MGFLARLGLISRSKHNQIVKDAVDKFNVYLAQQLEIKNVAVDETINQITNVSLDSLGGTDEPVVVRMEFPRSFAMALSRLDPHVQGFALDRIARRVASKMSQAINPPRGPDGVLYEDYHL